MNIKDFQLGCWSFVQKFMQPNLTSDLDKWLMYFGLGAGTIKFQKNLEQLIPMGQELGVVSQTGQIDIDNLQKYGKTAFAKQPKVKLWKFTFGEKDFDLFIEHLRTGTPTKKVKIQDVTEKEIFKKSEQIDK